MDKILEEEERIRQEQEEKERQLQEEEERKKRIEEGVEEDVEEPPKKSLKPESQERVPPKNPGIDNVDDDIKHKLLELWEVGSYNYKDQMRKVFE